MISYLFNNNEKIDNNFLVENFTNNYALEIIDNTNTNTVLGNTEMFIDIGKKYINILLYNDNININHIKEYLMERYYG